MHSTWSCAFQTPHEPHSRVGALLSEKWPYTRNWAKSRGGRSFVSGYFFTRLRYIRHKWRLVLSAFENFADIIEVLKPSSSTTVALCCNLIHYCRCFRFALLLLSSASFVLQGVDGPSDSTSQNFWLSLHLFCSLLCFFALSTGWTCLWYCLRKTPENMKLSRTNSKDISWSPKM